MKKNLPKGVFTFSEYRVANALFLQANIKIDRYNQYYPIVYIIAQYYNSYLNICGIFLYDHLFTLIGRAVNHKDNNQDDFINDNLVDILDNIDNKDYITNKYKLLQYGYE